MTDTTTASEATAERYEIGDRNASGRYPVDVDGQPTGHIYRWHGNWYVVIPGRTDEPRRGDRHSAAAHLVELVDSGAIDTTAATTHAPAAAQPDTIPWLSPKLRPTARNITSAAVALARLAELGWEPLEGYPGSDNPWRMKCRLCGKEVVRWWSHLRGRNGDNTPRPVWRHEDCIPFEEQAGKLAALVGSKPAACHCFFAHPTTVEAVADVLDQVAYARRINDGQGLLIHLTRLLGPCPAATARAHALKELKERPKG